MRRFLLAATGVALLAGTTMASAQVYFDDPPGWAWQRRGIIDESGRNPNNYGYRGYYGAYDAYGAYDGGYVVVTPRYYRRANPPGGRYQDRGIDEDLGRNPLRWR
jgi:hypothetical protein